MKIMVMLLVTAACVLGTKNVCAQQAPGDHSYNWNTELADGSNTTIPCGATFTISDNSNSDLAKTVTFSLPEGRTGTITVTLTSKNFNYGSDNIKISNGRDLATWNKDTKGVPSVNSTNGKVTIQFNNSSNNKNSTFTITVNAECDDPSQINWNNSQSSYTVPCGETYTVTKRNTDNDTDKTVTFSNESASTITVSLTSNNGLATSWGNKDKLVISDGISSEEWTKTNPSSSKTFTSHTGMVSIRFADGYKDKSSFVLSIEAVCDNSEINWNASNTSYNIDCSSTKNLFKSSISNDANKTYTFTQSNASIMTVSLIHNGLKSDRDHFDQLVISDGTNTIDTWDQQTEQNISVESTTGTISIQFLNSYTNQNSSYLIRISANCTRYTLTYDLNCGAQHTSGITPESGILVTVTDQQPGNCNGQTFDGWNTAANGNGTSYSAGDNIRLTANTTLYAQYHTYYTITYNTTQNWSCSGSQFLPTPTAINSEVLRDGASATVTDIIPNYCNDEKTFDHWNTAADDSGTPYYSREQITNISSDITLYAIYKNCYRLSYNTTANCPSQIVSVANQTRVTTTLVSDIIPNDCGEDPFTRWNTAADGSGTYYNPGQQITLTENTTLYAQYALSECSMFLHGKKIEGGAEIDNDTIYYNGCKGTPVSLEASITGEDSNNWDWSWYVNAHDANPQRMDGASISVTPANAVGYDINITAINKNNGCKLASHARLRVSNGLTPSTNSYTIPNGICISETRSVTVGSNADSYDISVPSQTIHVSAIKGQSEETFIPDGPNCTDRCYESTVTFTEFNDNARISSSSDIEYIRINMEHSFIGDVQISLVCPNGKSAIILPDWQTQNALDNFTYDYPYNGSESYGTQSYSHLPISFGIPSRSDGGSGKYCDSRYNTPGTGWDYCWSTVNSIDGQNISYANSLHSYVYETANHENAAPSVTYRVVKASDVEHLTQFYKPYQDFYNQLQGCPLNGTWKVKVCDSWKVDNGYVFEWDLKLSDKYYPDPWKYNVEIESLRLENTPDFISVSTENPTTITVQPTAENGGNSFEPILYVIDNLGCESQTPIDLNIEVKKPFTPTIDGSDKICFGTRANLSANHNIDAPTETPTYLWNDENSSATASMTTEELMESKTYTVTVTYRSCTATMSKDVEVSVPDPQYYGIDQDDFVWAGRIAGNEDDWNRSGNWIVYDANNSKYTLAGNNLPTSANNAFVISYGANGEECINDDPTLTAESFVNSLTIGTGHTVTVANQKLNISGDLVNDGTLSANEGTVEFNGSSDQSVKNAQVFNNVVFNQQNVNLISSLNGNFTINGNATFNKGIVDADVIFTNDIDAMVVNDRNLTYNSFVNKSVTKSGKCSNFVFPTGNDFVLGTVTATLSGTTDVTVSYHHYDGENADGSHGFTTDDMPRWWNTADMCAENDAKFNHVSNYEYWNVSSSENLTGVTLKVSSAAAADHYTTEDYAMENVYGTIYSNGCWMQASSSHATSDDGSTIVLNGVTVPAVSSRATKPSWLTFASINPSAVLPIELMSFTAKCERYGALLEWATASERDNDYFIIEHSSDAMNFSEIARIAGAGNSISTLNYSYVDYNMFGGDNYYRLIQVDYDGTRSASEIIALNCGDQEDKPVVEAYPNPFNSELNVSLKNFNNTPAKIELFDMLGKLVYFEEVDSTLNQYDTTLQLGHLAQATYTMRVCAGEFVEVKQIVKR